MVSNSALGFLKLSCSFCQYLNISRIHGVKFTQVFVHIILCLFAVQRGPVVEIVKLLRPLRYKVSLAEGAVVRRSVELASNEVKRVSCGDVVEVNPDHYHLIYKSAIFSMGVGGEGGNQQEQQQQQQRQQVFDSDNCSGSLCVPILRLHLYLNI